jgi:hypothetical protein
MILLFLCYAVYFVYQMRRENDYQKRVSVPQLKRLACSVGKVNGNF